VTFVVAAYFAGVLIGLAVMRDPWLTRVRTALVWPLGPIALLLVVLVLAVAAAILWPIPILGAVAALAAMAWLVL
jgi:hypothetical protein